MYFDASQYTAGVASPLWPQDVMQHQWYQHSQGNFDSYHDAWNGDQQQASYSSYNRSPYDNYGEDYREYGQYASYQVLDNPLGDHVFSQLANINQEPDEVLVVNSISSGAYASLCADAKIADLVAFDAEWAPDHIKGSDNPISVLQSAFPISRRAYVIQLDRINGRLPNEVQMMLVNPEVRKVGFAVDFNDRAKMARSGIAVTKGSVIDVQELCAAALGVGHSPKGLSLKHAALGLLGYQLLKDKRLSCSDWAKNELTPQQVRYAALDAWVPLRLCYSLL
jgi:hypothetical protein